jgi:hypothetical protein
MPTYGSFIYIGMAYSVIYGLDKSNFENGSILYICYTIIE